MLAPCGVAWAVHAAAQGIKMTRMLLSVLAASCIGVGFAVIVHSQARPPAEIISGAKSHDAGSVRFPGTEWTAEHDFLLTNTSRETIHIDHIAKSCSCLTVDFDDRAWEPGATKTVTIKLRLSGYGRRSANATLLEGEMPLARLEFSAIGAPDNDLSVAGGSFQFSEEGVAEFDVRLMTLDDVETPTAPILEPNVESVEATFLGWIKEMDGRPEETVPARYRGTIRIKTEGSVNSVRIRVSWGDITFDRMLYR